MICTDLDRSDQGMKNLRYDIRGNGPKNNIKKRTKESRTGDKRHEKCVRTVTGPRYPEAGKTDK